MAGYNRLQRTSANEHLDLLYFASTVLAIRLLQKDRQKDLYFLGLLATGTAKDPLTAKAVPLSSHDAAAARPTIRVACSQSVSGADVVHALRRQFQWLISHAATE